MSEWDGRTIRDLRPIKVSDKLTMAQLVELFKQDPLPPGTTRSLNPSSGFVGRSFCDKGVLAELYLQICTDDCESSSLAARLAKLRLLRFCEGIQDQMSLQARSQALREACQGWKVFRSFTDKSWESMSLLFDKANALLLSKKLSMMTGVGLATNASAAEQASDKAEFCGHCFNVGCIQTETGVQPLLLEGTAPMYSLRVDDKSPRVHVTLTDDHGQEEHNILNMPAFLCALSSTLLDLSGILNAPNGGHCSRACGWPMDVKVAGWLAKTTVSPALDSSRDTELPFYTRIMYMGWPCTTTGLGCMPVQESRSDGVIAGCHPFDLARADLRGVDATLDADTQRLMADIMEEAVPPQVSAETVRRIANLWLPCRPLELVNTEAIREPGVSYHRVMAMESPCAPEYLAIMHEAKCRLVKETNRINSALEDSDGIVLFALLEGVDSCVGADVMSRDLSKVTIVQSMKQAMINVGWPRKIVAPKAG
jgi:hypothetical protein